MKDITQLRAVARRQGLRLVGSRMLGLYAVVRPCEFGKVVLEDGLNLPTLADRLETRAYG